MKTDLTNEEWDDYKQLYASKDVLAAIHLDDDVRVNKGKG